MTDPKEEQSSQSEAHKSEEVAEPQPEERIAEKSAIEARSEEAQVEEKPLEETAPEEPKTEEQPAKEAVPEEARVEEKPLEEAAPEEPKTEEQPAKEAVPEEAQVEEKPLEEAAPEEPKTEEQPAEEMAIEGSEMEVSLTADKVGEEVKAENSAEGPKVEVEPIGIGDYKYLPPEKRPLDCKKVFLVSGSNKTMYHEVMQLLKKIGLDAVVSKSRINYTESMEQKFIDYPDIRLAIVLLGGDDFVYAKDSKPAHARLRASQDNVFEMAYFLAKLERKGVFILYQEQKNFLLPTDMMSAIYTPYAKGGHWRHELIKRLKLCEYPIDDIIEP